MIVTRSKARGSRGAITQKSPQDAIPGQTRYTLAEIDAVLTREGKTTKGQLLPRLRKAIRDGELAAYDPRPHLEARITYGTVSDYFEVVYWDDLNAWLDINEKRLTFRFPSPESGDASPALDRERRDEITRAIDRAIEQKGSRDIAKVWTFLKGMAVKGEDPFEGRDEKGLRWSGGHLTRKALGQRLARPAKRTAKDR